MEQWQIESKRWEIAAAESLAKQYILNPDPYGAYDLILAGHNKIHYAEIKHRNLNDDQLAEGLLLECAKADRLLLASGTNSALYVCVVNNIMYINAIARERLELLPIKTIPCNAKSFAKNGKRIEKECYLVPLKQFIKKPITAPLLSDSEVLTKLEALGCLV